MGRLKLLGKAISIGSVTEKYPFAPIDVPDDYRGKPVINEETCIGCGACANACLPKQLEFSQTRLGASELSIFSLGDVYSVVVAKTYVPWVR
ncbi:4Fe-4S binding protein [Thermococcus onnurineus]|uniref:4Fe-4S binding protein n=1 Tax=Thermococcus onnurineus TaxID=342948 RepID=UPI001EE56EE6|nr:4Fe-4S binding protein [Thermococcus onnurineus]